MAAADEWVPKRGLAEILRFVRSHEGWTQEDLAERVQAADPTGSGISASTVAKLETGDRSPSPRTLAAIATALGVSTADVRRVAMEWEESAERGAQPSRLFEILNATFGSRSTSKYGKVVSDRSLDAATGLADTRADTPTVVWEARIGLVPPGTPWLVPGDSVGVDGDGRLWIDPAASAMGHGPQEDHAAVERWDDGTFHADVSGLEVVLPRDPQRHTYRASLITDDPTHPEGLVDVYGETRITIELPDSDLVLDLTSRPPEMPEAWTTVHVITAWNPRSRLLLPSQNEERNRVLERQLRRLGLDPLPAVGSSRYGSWREDSFAVVNAPNDEILELAADWEQNAVFRWDDGGVHIEWTPTVGANPAADQ